DAKAKTIRLEKPTYDMKDDWASLGFGPVDMLIWAVDANNQKLCTAARRRFWKVPGFDGVKQQPLDWSTSIDRVIAYLLAPAKDQVQDYERGLPRSCWSCSEDNITGKRRLLSFPALHHPSFVFAYLEYASDFPDSKQAGEAIHQATQYADW